MTRQRFLVKGMTCPHCVVAVRQELEGIEGVTVHAVEIGWIDLSFDPDRTGPERLAAAVRRAGYELTGLGI